MSSIGKAGVMLQIKPEHHGTLHAVRHGLPIEKDAADVIVSDWRLL